MALIKGTTIVLYDRVRTGVDGFNAPVFTEAPVTVENVLICPVSTEDIAADLELYGKRAEYALCIPKEDSHIWEDRTVAFFGAKWRTIGFVQQWQEPNVPGPWNRRVKVERYG